MRPSNILSIESLDYEWRDKDEVMLHACFQLLVNCIEEEDLLEGHTDWDHNQEYKKAKKNIEQLYNWWQERKDIQFVGANDLDIFEEDSDKLKQLIDLRKYLWT